MRAPALLSMAASVILAAAPLAAEGPLVIVVNPESGVSQMSRTEATNIFMGRQKRLASDLVALPVEQMAPDATRRRFYMLLVHLPLPHIRAYWARLLFTGQAQPPRQAQTAEEVIELVAANRGAVGFLEKNKVTRQVKVVLELDEADPAS